MLSLWRVVRGSKLMHLDHLIHGLFITKHSLGYQQHLYRQLLFIYVQLAIILTFTHNHNVHIRLIYIGAFPLLFISLADSLLLPFFDSLYLLGNPPFCDRIHPPRSRVTRKLTSPFLNPPHPSPLQIPRTQVNSASLRRPQESGFSCPEQGGCS